MSRSIDQSRHSGFVRATLLVACSLCCAAFAGPVGGQQANPERRPVPPEKAIKAAQEQIEDEYRVQLATSKLSGDKLLLADKLRAAVEPAKSPALNYALLTKALDLAVEGGDPNRIMQTIDLLAGGFDIRAAQLRLESLRSSAKLRREPSSQAAIAASAIDAIEPLVAADDYAVASQMALLAKSAGTSARNKRLISLGQNQGRRLGKIEREWEKLGEQFARLEANPGDPDANTALGLFYCTVVGDWNRGLASLAHGTAALQEAAGRDAAAPTQTADQIDAGEKWESAAAEVPAEHRETLLTRARHWYQLAAAQVDGKERQALLLRIAKLPAPTFQLHVFIEAGDGHGRLQLIPGEMIWHQLSFNAPTTVHLNDLAWDVTAKTRLSNTGSTEVFPADLCFSSARLTKLRGRGPVKLINAGPTEVVVSIDDHAPAGADDYEFVLRFAGK